MKLHQVLLASAIVLSSALTVHADSISPTDPQIIVGRGLADQTAITTLAPFGVPVDAMGGGLFGFENETGKDLTGLILTIGFKDANDAKAFAATSCANSATANNVFQDIFNTCSFSRHGKTLTITLSGGEGIPNNSAFFIDLNDGATLANHGQANGAGGWGGTLNIQPFSTPEPGTLALLVTGLGGFWLRRKRT